MLFLSLFSLHFVCDLRVSFPSRSLLNIIFLVRHFEILEVCNEAFLVSFNLPRQVALIRHLFEGFANAECQVFATDVSLVNLVINHDRGMEHQLCCSAQTRSSLNMVFSVSRSPLISNDPSTHCLTVCTSSLPLMMTVLQSKHSASESTGL